MNLFVITNTLSQFYFDLATIQYFSTFTTAIGDFLGYLFLDTIFLVTC